MKFTKLVASGNDFIVIDNRRHIFPAKNKKLIQKLCAVHTGIGADGILLLENSNIADFKMRIFNPDGSEPNMCGNGARCISLYAWKKKIIPKSFSVETLAGIIKAQIVSKGNVKIYLNVKDQLLPGRNSGHCEQSEAISTGLLRQPINRLPRNDSLSIIFKELHLTVPKDIKLTKKIYTINTGVPHAIIYVSKIDRVDVNRIGKKIRWSKAYQPGGTNVDFVQILGKNRISVRTYERGVEGETLACGTGVTASAIISVLFHKLKSPLYAETKSGDTLIVDTDKVSLTGPARFVFEGFMNL